MMMMMTMTMTMMDTDTAAHCAHICQHHRLIDVCRMSLGGASARAAAVDDETKYRYSMEHHERGRMIIINNRTFHPQTGMNERGGTDKDAASLYTDFNQLGFSVQLVHNRTADQMLQLMISGKISARHVHLMYILVILIDCLQS